MAFNFSLGWDLGWADCLLFCLKNEKEAIASADDIYEDTDIDKVAIDAGNPPKEDETVTSVCKFRLVTIKQQFHFFLPLSSRLRLDMLYL